MTNVRFVKSYSDVDVTREQSDRIWERLMQDAQTLDIDPVEPMVSSLRSPRRKLWRTVLIAAVISSLLGVTAYAADFLGMRAMFIPDSEELAYKYEDQADGSRARVEAPEGGFISLTQPQTVPADIDQEIAGKVENNRLAWDEWWDWRQEHRFKMPEKYAKPEEAWVEEHLDNPDGTVTIQYYRGIQLNEETHKPENYDLIEERLLTAEEYAEYRGYIELETAQPIPGYDYFYHVMNEEMAEKIEQIADKYSLVLRGDRTVLFQQADGFAYAGSYPLAKLVELLSENACSGPLFNRNPDSIDHAYYYDEGTFAVDYNVYASSSGEKLWCYGYNSPYATLSSGEEVFSMEEDLTAFTARSHTAPDGTELTVLSNGRSAYIYVYLENSYYAQSISSLAGLTDEDVDYIADAVNYRNIGK